MSKFPHYLHNLLKSETICIETSRSLVIHRCSNIPVKKRNQKWGKYKINYFKMRCTMDLIED